METVPQHVKRGRPGKEIVFGMPYGRLTVIAGPFCNYPKVNRRYHYRCRCECGAICDVQVANLNSDNTTSCGCAKRDRQTKHGESRSRIYNERLEIIRRCYNP